MPPIDDDRPEESRSATTLQASTPVSPSPTAGIQLLPTDPANQQRAVAALFIAMLSLAGLLGLNDVHRGVDVAMFALLAGVVALWLSIGSVIRARRHRTKRPRGSVTATIIAGIGTALSAMILVTFAVLSTQLSTYGQCMAGANTITAQQSCQTQFTHAVSRKIAALRSAGNG